MTILGVLISQRRIKLLFFPFEHHDGVPLITSLEVAEFLWNDKAVNRETLAALLLVVHTACDKNPPRRVKLEGEDFRREQLMEVGQKKMNKCTSCYKCSRPSPILVQVTELTLSQVNENLSKSLGSQFDDIEKCLYILEIAKGRFDDIDERLNNLKNSEECFSKQETGAY